MNIVQNVASPRAAGSECAAIKLDDTRIFPNQFLIAPEPVSGLLNWQALHIGDGLHVTAHPGIGLLQVGDTQRSLTLLGFILDANDPGATDEAILQRLLDGFSSLDELLDATSSCGGRWVIVAQQGEHAWLFTDAMGLRQSFFTPERHGTGLWVGSQPGIMAEYLGLDIDEAANRFMHSYGFRSNAEYRWPGNRTPYKEIRHLLPNRYLDLRSGQDHRYWPTRPLDTVSPEDAAEQLARLLPALIEAAARRFDLALALTAGWDSRLVLAASRGVKDGLDYMTLRQGKMADSSTDVVIASRLLARLGLSHEVVPALPTMSAEFSYRFKRSVFLAHDHYGGDAEAILGYAQRRKVVITGSGAEIGRRSYRWEMPDIACDDVTSALLIRLQQMDASSQFAVGAFDEWLSGLGDRRGLKVLDLFEWEQEHGNWLAMTQLEFDSGWQDIFTPYNCRDVLALMLSVEERYRWKPEHQLYADTIRRLWPEVMCEPINPEPKVEQARGPLAGTVARLRKLRRRFSSRV